MSSSTSPSQDAWAIIQGLDGVDQKLLAHPGVAHIPSILVDDELLKALVYDGAKEIQVATDRRIIHITTSFWKSNVQKVVSHPYDTMLSFVPTAGAFESSFTMMTDKGVITLPGGKKQHREQFAKVVNECLRVSPSVPAAVTAPSNQLSPQDVDNSYASPKDEAIAHVIRNMSDFDKGRTTREVAELPSVLWEDELPEMATAGVYHFHNGMLVATDRRVLFIDKGLISLKVEDFGYDRISSVESKTGMMMGEIKLYTAGNSETFDNIEKGEVRAFADFIRSKINKAPTAAPPAAGGLTVADELMKFAELLDKRVITQIRI